MTQITSGIRSILSQPLIYNMSQNLLGAKAARVEFVTKYCQPEEGQRWLDIGCGTAELLKFLDNSIHYVGFDASETYIQSAKESYKCRDAVFYTELITENSLLEFDKFERMSATGLLHHLEDNEVFHLFKSIKPALAKGGRFVSIDPCFIAGQSVLSKALVERDRGQNVRQLEEYAVLAQKVFDDVKLIHRNDMLRIPYDHAILICQ